MSLRRLVTSVTDAETRFLEDIPDEIRDVLEWYGDRQARVAASQKREAFGDIQSAAPRR